MKEIKKNEIMKENRNSEIIRRNDKVLEVISFQELSNILGGNKKQEPGTVVGKSGFFCSCHTGK